MPYYSIDHKIIVIEIDNKIKYNNILKKLNYKLLEAKIKDIKINNVSNLTAISDDTKKKHLK